MGINGRQAQLTHVRNTIDHVIPNLIESSGVALDLRQISFMELRGLLVAGSRVPRNVSPERYTAMVRSVITGATQDGDGFR